MDIKEHFKLQIDLLETERKEDLEQYKKLMSDTSIEERKKKGVCWFPIKLENVTYDSGDRIVIKISRDSATSQSHSFSTGKSISLFSQSGNNHEAKDNAKAVVNFVKDNELTMTLNQDDEPEWLHDGKLGVQLLFDESSYKEMDRALNICMSSEDKELNKMKKIILGNESPSTSKIYPFQLPQLNDSQNDALMHVLAADQIGVIHGPPGTGKTTTLVECVHQELKKKQQILVCAPSNAAVDLLTEKLSEKGINVVRLGHPARVDEKILNQTLDVKIKKHQRYKELKAIKQQETLHRDAARKFKRNFGPDQRRERKALYQEANQLRKEIRSLSEYISKDVIDNAQVISCTLVGSTTPMLRGRRFEVAYIDEAGQALEAACWIPILKSNKIIFAGDHQQLPPTIKSIQAAKKGLEYTLFERIIDHKNVDKMLKTQYRMHKDIMAFSSKYFYDNQLDAFSTNAEWKMFDDDQPMEFIDTAGTGYEEKVNPESLSTYNIEEANLLILHLKNYLIQLQEAPNNIGIITPYSAQVKVLRRALYQSDISDEIKEVININTVDSFQGQEREIIYISMVRSNPDGEIGFLANARRMNVAMTRAQKKLVMIGDSATITRNKYYAEMFDFVNEIGAYRSAFEFIY
ncbi:AAA family ATPase [Flammeovirga yaeyamensis]|uniref:DNA helicase n=1 Tax=Flammeovirga yaeyamensis TaxID=367791 RepID=A0AAX1MYR0_9BACT|nr:AAA domain-containing protein [Flammeovirga yaeyamensis]MBB3696102.1 superfamily I DNA and/or RNA helicase [Flammeovirga yaeyamensis]NMF34787.1 AAA family ATPase [Flammeovirga yaeyamensis]QWG00385.1 AAA family ATPase [Flammeovirga yaeyamensis]